MRRRWIARLSVLVIWLIATTSIAFLVARHERPATLYDGGSIVPPIQISERAKVALTSQTISPIVSGDGVVVVDGPVFDPQASIRPADLAYKLLTPPGSVKALILGGPIGFDCGWLGILQTDDGMVMRCRIPVGIDVVAGLSGTMVLSMSKPLIAMALPATAVLGSAQQGQVIVVGSDGTSSIRQIGLGVSDTFWIEVTSGLDAGEMVLTNPVQSDFASSSS